MSGWSAARSEEGGPLRRRAASDAGPAALSRRQWLHQGGWWAVLAGCGALPARQALAAAGSGFEATSLQDALRALGGEPLAGPDIVLSVPELVENGGVVPVSVMSRLPRTEEISIVVELNPYPLIARFSIPDGTEPFVATRIKLARSGSVCAIVRADGRLYSATRDTQVIASGCGG